MIEQVELKLQQLRQQQKDEYNKKKASDLAEWGFSTSKKSGNGKVPLIVTDDEYEALIEASAGISEYSRNSTASLLNICSIAIFAIGIILGIVLASFVESLGFVYFSVAVLISAVLAVLFRGVAEAVRLLQQLIDMKRSEQIKNLRSAEKAFPEKQPEIEHSFKNAPPIINSTQIN